MQSRAATVDIALAPPELAAALRSASDKSGVAASYFFAPAADPMKTIRLLVAVEIAGGSRFTRDAVVERVVQAPRGFAFREWGVLHDARTAREPMPAADVECF